MLCCLLCLTVCAAPVFANDITGVFLHNGTFGYVANRSDFSTPIIQPFNDFSATFEYLSSNVTPLLPNMPEQKVMAIDGGIFSVENSDGNTIAVYPNDVYFEVIFPVGSGDLTISDSNIQTVQHYFSPPQIFSCSSDGDYLRTSNEAIGYFFIELLVDDVVIASLDSTNNFEYSWPASFNYSGPVTQRFSVRFHVHNPVGDYVYTNLSTSAGYCRAHMYLPYDVFSFSGSPVDVDNLEIVIGQLDSISGEITEIKSQVVDINNNVSAIKDGLQDSNSSIWGAFKDSVSSIFVPSTEDLEGVKNGFDQLARDKLGGAYQSVDLVKDGVSQVRDKIGNPTADYSVEFPGIEVPLGEMYGTVRLIGRQDVTIPQKMRDILYPIAGIIIPIVCTTWTVRLGIDMVNCFMSGMSYAEFLHRFTDREDDEA